MPYKSYTAWNQWNILPLSAITLAFKESPDTRDYYFKTMDAKTEFSFKYMLEDNDLGGQTPVGVMIEGTIGVVQNDIKNFKQFYLDCLNEKCTRVILMLFNPESEDRIIDINNSPQYGQTPRPNLTVENYEVVPEFIAKAPAPQIILKVRGFLDLSIIQTYFDLFFQTNWG